MIVKMTIDRRTAVRVRLSGTRARILAEGPEREHTVRVVNVSPQGACVTVPWSAESATRILLGAWMGSGAVRLVLDGSPETATVRVHWVSAPGLDRPLFGLHFVEPITSFAPLVRSLAACSG